GYKNLYDISGNDLPLPYVGRIIYFSCGLIVCVQVGSSTDASFYVWNMVPRYCHCSEGGSSFGRPGGSYSARVFFKPLFLLVYSNSCLGRIARYAVQSFDQKIDARN